jgi:hypothetical protein
MRWNPWTARTSRYGRGQVGDATSHPSSPLQALGGLALSDSEKAEVLADSLEAQPVGPGSHWDGWWGDVRIQVRTASEQTVTKLSEVLQAIKGLKVGKAPGPKGIPNRALRHLAKHAMTLLTKVFNAVLRRYSTSLSMVTHSLGTHTQAVKDPTLPSSYRPISLPDTVGKLSENILLTRDLREVNARGLLRDEQFVFLPKHSATLQLARLVERVNRNSDKKGLTGAVSLDVDKTLHRTGQRSLYKPTILRFLSYLLKTVCLLPNIPNVLPVSHIHTSLRAGWGGATWLAILCSSVCMQATYLRPHLTSRYRRTRTTRLS